MGIQDAFALRLPSSSGGGGLCEHCKPREACGVLFADVFFNVLAKAGEFVAWSSRARGGESAWCWALSARPTMGIRETECRLSSVPSRPQTAMREIIPVRARMSKRVSATTPDPGAGQPWSRFSGAAILKTAGGRTTFIAIRSRSVHIPRKILACPHNKHLLEPRTGQRGSAHISDERTPDHTCIAGRLFYWAAAGCLLCWSKEPRKH